MDAFRSATLRKRHPGGFGPQGGIHDSGDLVDLIGGLPPRPGAMSHRPSSPSSPKRFRQRITVFRFTESRFAIVISESPAATAKTMRQRKATCCGVPCAAVHCCSFSCSILESRHDFLMPKDTANRLRLSSHLLDITLERSAHFVLQIPSLYQFCY